MDRRRDYLREDLMAWSKRSPRRPASEARAAVLSQIGQRSSVRTWRLATAVASAAVVLAVVVRVLSPDLPGPATHDEGEMRAAAPASQLVIELDSGTKLYMALDAARMEQRSRRTEDEGGV